MHYTSVVSKLVLAYLLVGRQQDFLAILLVTAPTERQNYWKINTFIHQWPRSQGRAWHGTGPPQIFATQDLYTLIERSVNLINNQTLLKQ